jgi:hypothetical protein
MRQLAYQSAQLGVARAAPTEIARHAGRKRAVRLQLDVVLRDERIIRIMRLSPGGEACSKLARNRAPIPCAMNTGCTLIGGKHASSLGGPSLRCYPRNP